MDKKTYISLAVAAVFGILAVALTNAYLEQQRKAIFKGTAPVQVLVAKGPLKAGVALERAMMDVYTVPEKFVRASATRPKDMEMIIGQKLKNDLLAGDPILFTDFGVGGSEGELRLQDIVKPGDRALSMPVDDRTGISGLLQPGDHVDIIGTFTDAIKKERVTVTVLQNVAILAVGGKVAGKFKGGADSKYSTITLLVSQEESEILVFALGQGGSLTYVLRHQSDVESSKQTPKVNMDTILKPEVREVLQQKRNQRVQILRGGK